MSEDSRFHNQEDSQPENYSQFRTISEHDISAIVVAMRREMSNCDCPVDQATLLEMVKAFRNFNSWIDGSKKTIWSVFLGAVVLGLIALLGVGLWHKSGN